MNLEEESEKRLDLNDHIILELDILGYRNLIQEDDETRILRQFDLMVTTVKKDIAGIHDINNTIHWKMYSDNFLIYAQLPTNENLKYATIMGVLLLGCKLQYRLITDFGYMSRGGCCFGKLHVDETYVFGSGLVEAHNLEIEHKEPTISVAQDVVEYLSHRESNFPDTVESKSFIRKKDNSLFVDYLNFIIVITRKYINTDEWINHTIHDHRNVYETKLRPRLINSIERNKNNENEVYKLNYKNKWFINYHNTICTENCFFNEMIKASDLNDLTN